MRLEVTRKNDLAVSVFQVLADERVRVKGPHLSDAVGNTAGFVPQMLTPLVRAGCVRSDPGPTGGYSLAVDAATVSVLAVIEAVEGPTDSGRRVLADRPCGEIGLFALHEPWTRVRSGLLRELDRTAVADAPVVVEAAR